MFALILLIIFGLGMAVFATQNTGVVHIMLGSYMLYGIPLYVLVIGSILLGILISWFLSTMNSFSLFKNLHDKDITIKNEEHTIHDLQKRNAELTTEVTRLKEEKLHTENESTKEEEHHPSVIERIRNNFAV